MAVKAWYLFLLVVMIGLVSCQSQGVKGLRCSKGKGRKAKTYRLKKTKPYQRGYPVARSSTPQQEQAQNQEEKPEEIEPEVTFQEVASLEGFPPKKASLQSDTVQVTVFQEKNPEPAPREVTPTKQDTIYRRTVVRKQNEVPKPEPEPTVSQEAPDTIYRRTVERKPLEENPEQLIEEQELTVEKESPDTIFRRTVVQKVEENPEEQARPTKDTIFTRTVNRQVEVNEINIPESSPNLSTDIRFEVKKKNIVYKGEMHEFEDSIEFQEKILFIPNYDVFMNDKKAVNKIRTMANLLIAYPDRSVTIRANAGWDVRSASDSPNYTVDPDTGEKHEIYYGKSKEVYEQIIWDLGLPEGSYEERRIRYLGLELVDRAVIGDLLQARNEKVKNELIKLGVNASQIKTELGEFARKNNHQVDFILE